MPIYHLQRHVDLCVLNHAAIFLDRRKDEYIGLSERQMHALSRMVRGWPIRDTDGTLSKDDREDALTLAENLVNKGLLTKVEAKGKEAAQANVVAAAAYLIDPDEWLSPQYRARYFVNLVASYAAAQFTLKCLSLDLALAFLSRRKRHRTRSEAANIDDARTLMHTFLALRPLLYTVSDKCLLDSFVLVDFLAKFGLDSTLVLGVTTNPFGAHCWVQIDHFLLNGTLEAVRRHSPIVVM